MMIEIKPYELSVGSASEYDELIAEIKFSDKFGVIVSQEDKEGQFDISIHSFSAKSAEDFDYCRNKPDKRISLEKFNEAIERATSELRRLRRE